MTTKSVFGILAPCLLLAGTVLAQTTANPTPTASASPSPSASATSAPGAAQPAFIASIYNIDAINFLHFVNTREIIEGNYAQANGQGTSTQSFAQTLVTDHRQNEQQVQQLASQKGIPFYPFQLASYQQATETYVASLRGQQFDQAFMLIEAQSHLETLARLQALQGIVTDADIKNLITQTIPVVQKHIQLASGSPQPASSGSPTPAPSPSASPQAGASGSGM